jgi:hypothetical protein
MYKDIWRNLVIMMGEGIHVVCISTLGKFDQCDIHSHAEELTIKKVLIVHHHKGAQFENIVMELSKNGIVLVGC